MNREEAQEKVLEAARDLRRRGVPTEIHRRPPKTDDLEAHYRVSFDLTAGDEDVRREILHTEEELRAEGITFDTGYDLEGRRDWELDWSLRVVE